MKRTEVDFSWNNLSTILSTSLDEDFQFMSTSDPLTAELTECQQEPGTSSVFESAFLLIHASSGLSGSWQVH